MTAWNAERNQFLCIFRPIFDGWGGVFGRSLRQPCTSANPLALDFLYGLSFRSPTSPPSLGSPITYSLINNKKCSKNIISIYAYGLKILIARVWIKPKSKTEDSHYNLKSWCGERYDSVNNGQDAFPWSHNPQTLQNQSFNSSPADCQLPLRSGETPRQPSYR